MTHRTVSQGHTWRTLALAAAAWLAFAAAAQAADGPAAPPLGTAASGLDLPAVTPLPEVTVEIERTVYVPYEKLREVFEKEGRGIFLPYEEFLKLWRAAQPKPPAPEPRTPPAPVVIRGGTYTGTVAGDVARFSVVFTLDALAEGWSEIALPLKDVALEKVTLSDPRALFSTRDAAYTVYLPDPGAYEVALEFSVRVTQEPGKKSFAFGVPPVAVSRLEITVPEKDVRVDVKPSLAVTQTEAQGDATRIMAVLGNAAQVAVSWMPPAGARADGGAVFFASQSVRLYLGERILRLTTDVTFQVVRGEVDTLRVTAPAGMRLLSVKGDPNREDNIRRWDQQGDVVVVELHSALKDVRGAGDGGTSTYLLALTFERILDDTPAALPVPFPRVEDVIRESGWVVFAHDSGLNVRVRETTGLSRLDPDEVPETLRPSLGVGYRYFAQPLAMALDIETITPEIRAVATSVVSLGVEEDAWVGWIDYQIARAGVFRFQFSVPPRWSVVQIGDDGAVEDFQTGEDAGGAVMITVSLKSKAIGPFRLPFKLAAQGSAGEAQMTLVPPAVAGAVQDRGLFGVSAPKAFTVSTVTREKMTSADVDLLFRSGIMTRLGSDAGMPLTYGYRESGASVTVKLEAKKTEIDGLAQHLVEVFDGGIKLTHILDYDILYAAVDRLRFAAPTALDHLLNVETKSRKEVTRIATAQDMTVWEITLQAPALGAVSVTVTHEQELKALEPGRPFVCAVPLVRPHDVRERNGFVALRKEGTLEIMPTPTGMEALDAVDLPDKLRRGQIYSAFRYFTADPALSLTLTRYDYQALATTVVSAMHLESVLYEEMRVKTKAVLMVQNTERQYLEITFSPDVNIFSIAVDGKPQKPRQRKDDTATRLIQIPTSKGAGGIFAVEIVYEETLGGAMGRAGRFAMKTPTVLGDVPVTKVELDLFLPPEYAYLAWSGTLKPRFGGGPGLWARFKDWVNDTLKADNRRTPASEQARGAGAPPQAPAGAIGIEIPTEGYVCHPFHTLASVGTVEAVYIGRTLFSCIDFLAFAVALAGGYVLAVRMKRCRIGTAVLVVFVPLILVWLSQGAVVEIFSSLLAGGSALFLGMGAVGAVRAVRAHRVIRLSTAPDPYLEDAPEPAPPPSAREAGADDTSASADPSVMEEKPEAEAGGEAGADPNGKKGS